MANENVPAGTTEGPISKDDFAKRDEALTKALDKLEKEIHPPKTKPEPIGGMF